MTSDEISKYALNHFTNEEYKDQKNFLFKEMKIKSTGVNAALEKLMNPEKERKLETNKLEVDLSLMSLLAFGRTMEEPR